MKTVDMTGAVMRGLSVIGPTGSRGGRAIWRCRCSCGSEFDAVGTSLRMSRVTECPSCARASRTAKATKHGLVDTREYHSYHAMKARCYNPLNKRYPRYGGRGISVCARWMESFYNFIDDMGMQPSPNHSIERKNTDGNYEPGNCIWATVAVQASNRSNNTLIEINGRIQTMAQWSRESGINRTVILRRMKRGFTGAALIHKGVLK